MIDTAAPAVSLPKIGDVAPDFTATSTQGPLTFSQWQEGKWVVFFSHPADFTPVCATEITEFARRSSDFEKRGVKLIGLSVDSIHSHLAWIQNLEKILDAKVRFPMIADSNTAVAQKYGMIHPGASETVTVRTVFVIDPKRVVRGVIYYPLNVGRNIDEVLRLVDALQTADQNSVSLPVNWKPGDKVIVPAPKTASDVADRLSGKYESLDFYLCKKTLDVKK
jgi:peroxiredoxin (alkyl hydroperoxide reductase subunit C)